MPSGCQRLISNMLTKRDYRNKIKHDQGCFTQGLFLDKDILYESCGAPPNTTSRLKKIDFKTNKTLLSKTFPDFLEGLTVIGDIIYLLTWKNEILYMVDKNDFRIINKCNYSGQGWGLTSDGEHLIFSNGTSKIFFYRIPDRKTENLSLVKEIDVGVSNLNELEYIDGHIYANLWFNDEIIKIDPETANIVEKKDYSYLRKDENSTSGALNGIAYSEKNKQLLLTGKNWKYMYLI